MGTKPTKPRKRPATRRKGKAWLTRARLDLLPLEPQVAKMVIQRTDPKAIAAWIRAQGTFTVDVPGEEEPEVSRGPYAEVTDEQVVAFIQAIVARWEAVRDDPATINRERALHAETLKAAIHDAWNKPIMVYDKDAGGFVPLKNPDGTVAVTADHKALAAYLRESREFYGFGAPQKHVHAHLHGTLPPPEALSPADREAAIREMLERRRRALEAGNVQAPAIIDAESKPADAKALPAPRKKSTRTARKGVDG